MVPVDQAALVALAAAVRVRVVHQTRLVNRAPIRLGAVVHPAAADHLAAVVHPVEADQADRADREVPVLARSVDHARIYPARHPAADQDSARIYPVLRQAAAQAIGAMTDVMTDATRSQHQVPARLALDRAAHPPQRNRTINPPAAA